MSRLSAPLKLLIVVVAVLGPVCLALLMHQQWRKSQFVLTASSLSRSERQARYDSDRLQRLNATKLALLENSSGLPKFVKLNPNTEYGFHILDDDDFIVCIFGPRSDSATGEFVRGFIGRNRRAILGTAESLGHRVPQGTESDLAEELFIAEGISPEMVTQYWVLFAPLEFFVDRESDCIVIYTKKPAGFIYAGYKGYTKLPESVGRKMKVPTRLPRTW